MKWNALLWQRPTIVHYLLLPIALLYALLIRLRRAAYSAGIIARYTAPVPIVVVGNITVGGNGKTPLVQLIAMHLTAKGLAVGIVCRGYPLSPQEPLLVSPTASGKFYDEACLLAQSCAAPVVIAKNRSRAVQWLTANFSVDVIISDDGLQHYALNRTLEIAAFDTLQIQNRFHLPAGPFREPLNRLDTVDAIVITCPAGQVPTEERHAQLVLPQYKDKIYYAHATIEGLFHPATGKQEALSSWQTRAVRVVSAIAKPLRLTSLLTSLGLEVAETIFYQDHAWFDVEHLPPSPYPTLITQKDHARMTDRQLPASFWVTQLAYQLSPPFFKNHLATLYP